MEPTQHSESVRFETVRSAIVYSVRSDPRNQRSPLHVGKAIGIKDKDKVASDRLGGDLAAARDGVGAVGDFINSADLPRVERSDRGNHRGVRKDRIARAGRLDGKHFPNQARLQTANRISLTPMAFTP